MLPAMANIFFNISIFYDLLVWISVCVNIVMNNNVLLNLCSQSRRGGGGPRNGMRNGRGRGRAQGQGQGQGRGRGRGKKQPAEKSVDDLDKELESYHAEAMQT
jgi:hypothetical protein